MLTEQLSFKPAVVVATVLQPATARAMPAALELCTSQHVPWQVFSHSRRRTPLMQLKGMSSRNEVCANAWSDGDAVENSINVASPRVLSLR